CHPAQKAALERGGLLTMALKRITLRDFVIVQELTLDLQTGFTVLTGETGAGKSILVDALQLALGSRADAGYVREGASHADVCAEFDYPCQLQPWFGDAGIEANETLLLRRTIGTQGKSRGWINGTPATATQLRFLGDQLLDIHGQHAALWTKWRADQKILEEARAAQSSLQQERERLQWQIAEVSKLAPAEDEWAHLEAQHKRLSHAQTLLEVAQGALATLEEEASGAQSSLARATSLLQSQELLEPAFSEMADILSSSLAQTNDVIRSLQAYLRHTDLDPDRLADLDLRLSQWMTLARRYKRQPTELPALLQAWKRELQQLDAAADLVGLETAQASSAKAYQTVARAISLRRTRAAPKLSAAITQAMQGLGMTGGVFEVSVTKTAEPALHGLDEIAFLVAGHPGMTPRPIGKVASGGELSRISLAISVTTSQLGTAPTLVFDEVDSGVGGAVAETVGRLMRQLGRDRQVLAVTHLPQVAAYADHHLMVSKRRNTKGTTSTVTPVLGDLRVTEVARMLGGERPTGTSLAHASEMLSLANTPQKG
ncbi:MAG: hypothetical protein RL081_2146, partial [Pseudomonadota bacterium]